MLSAIPRFLVGIVRCANVCGHNSAIATHKPEPNMTKQHAIAPEIEWQYSRLNHTHTAADTRPLRLEDQNQLCPVEGGWLCAQENVGLRHDWLDAAKDEAMRHAVSLTEQPEDDLFGGVFGPCFDRQHYDTALDSFYF